MVGFGGSLTFNVVIVVVVDGKVEAVVVFFDVAVGIFVVLGNMFLSLN